MMFLVGLLFCLVAVALRLLRMSMLYIGFGNDPECQTTLARVNSEVYHNSFYDFSTPKCYECINPKFVLDINGTRCLSKCPTG